METAMLCHARLEHRFVQYIPDKLEPGIIYVSMEFATAAHACCCGCGEQVITPFTPTDWKLTFDGETVSLWPSIGNWNFQCRSHYIIRRSRIIEAESWNDKRIENNRRRGNNGKEDISREPEAGCNPPLVPTAELVEGAGGLWNRLKRSWGKR